MKNLLLSILLLCSISVHAQSFLDSTFGINGVVLSSYAPPHSAGIRVIKMQDDGKIVAVGGEGGLKIIRYNENGTLDNTFAVAGMFSYSLSSGSSGNAMILQTDGKIVIEGSAFFSGGFLLTLRLNTDGSLDPTFGSGGIVYTGFRVGGGDNGKGVAQQADGKIVIGASDNGLRFGLVRLLSDGQLDDSFGDTGIVVTNTYGSPVGVSIMSDGRIVTAGHNNPNYFLVAMRFLPNGLPDTSFNHTGFAAVLAGDSYNIGTTMFLQPDGKIIVGGSGTFGVTGADFALIRYNTDGLLDRSFGDTGVVNIDFNRNEDEVWALTMDANGRIVAAGTTTVAGHEQFAMARIDSNGKVDSSFGVDGRITTNINDSFDAAHAVAIQHDTKIILAGTSYTNMGQLAITRYINTATGIPRISNKIVDPILYPNPTSGELTISNTSHISAIAAHNVLGDKIPLTVDLPTKKVKLYSVANGMYFFTISFDNKRSITQKIFIHN